MSTNTELDDVEARAEVNKRLGKTASQDEAKDTLKLIAAVIDDRIDRRVKSGAKTAATLGGLRHMGGHIVIECKNHGRRLLPGPWIAETETERGNDDALAGIVIAKRLGTTEPGDQYVLMALNTSPRSSPENERRTHGSSAPPTDSS